MKKNRAMKLTGYWLYGVISGLLLSNCTSTSSLTAANDNNLEWNKKIAVAYVHSYAIAISKALPEMKDDSAKINYIRQSIDPIRFYPDSSGYFYVYDTACVNIAHAIQKNLQGQNLYDYQDSRGTYVIRALSAMAKKGGGYVEYYWIKPGETGEKMKLGYVEPIPNTGYFIGSGVYLE